MPSSRSTLASRRRIVGRRRALAADVDRAVDQPRAGQLEHQLGRDDLAVHRLLGREALLEAPGGLGAQRELRRGALDVRAVPVRGLHQHARGGLARPRSARRPSGRRSTSGRPRRRSAARSASSVRSTSSSVVICSPSVGAAHGQPAAGDEVEVERVQRLARQQHRVVGDVDDVVDRALAGGRSAAPSATRGDGPIVTSSNSRAVKRGHRSGSSTTTSAPATSPGAAGVLGPRRRRQRRAGGGVDLARDAVDARGSRAGSA